MEDVKEELPPPPIKRYRREENSESEEDIDNYEPYVPVKERKKQQLIKLGRVGQLAAEAAAEPKSSSDNDPDDESKSPQFIGYVLVNVFLLNKAMIVMIEPISIHVIFLISLHHI